ncbi:MAG: response regulator transcription factor [Propionibacteriaceae bacterium]|nr:response regulator transcription factor [Propionibacteriaceae bacterium]
MVDTIKVLLVDDQELLRMGYAMVLDTQDDIDVVGEASDGASALQLIGELRPDVVLMDVRMPGMDGIEATARAIQTYPDVKIIVLTTFDLDEYAFAALRAGASGFLLKDVKPADLAAAIRQVHAGDAAVSPRVTRAMLELFASSLPAPGADATTTPAGHDHPRLASLTDREIEVLETLAEGLSNVEIAERLFLTESTVKTHLGNILAKLGLRDRVQAVVLAFETGLVTP